MVNPPDFRNLKSIPTIGHKIDDAGIKVVREALVKLESGEFLNIAFVAEKANGDMAIVFSPGVGNPMKQAGATGILHRRVEDSIIGGK